MVSTKVKDNEPLDVLMRRFKRACEKAGILTEIRRREFYEKPTEARKRRAAAAVKRRIKRLMRENPITMRGHAAAKRSPAASSSSRDRGDRGDRNN